eukprot:9189940-Heterocapsa_arctica.AAC.1
MNHGACRLGGVRCPQDRRHGRSQVSDRQRCQDGHHQQLARSTPRQRQQFGRMTAYLEDVVEQRHQRAA